jgi:DNA-binding MarR family transcriptional regulator
MPPIMRSLVNIAEPEESRSAVGSSNLTALIMHVRLAIMSALDQEFLADREVAPLEVTTAQFAILKNVLRGSAKSACDLCKAMDYDRGAMSRMIDRLETKQLIRRVPLAHTRRAVAIEVTAAGRAAFPKMEACLDRVLDRLLKGVTKSQIREMESVLKQMLANA